MVDNMSACVKSWVQSPHQMTSDVLGGVITLIRMGNINDKTGIQAPLRRKGGVFELSLVYYIYDSLLPAKF